MDAVLFVANWKMNLRLAEQEQLVRGILDACTFAPQVEIVLCPSYTNLPAVADMTKRFPVHVGSQDVSARHVGAFTGEIAAEMLKDFTVTYCIVGHSERRKYFGETDAEIRDKIKACLANDIVPIICVGESFEDRQQNQQDRIVTEQIRQALHGVVLQEKNRIVIAYEPVWAIGTGQSASPEVAAHMAQVINQVITDYLHDSASRPQQRPCVLYGGSVQADTIQSFVGNGYAGVLVGGASLHVEDFCHMIQVLID